MRSPACAVPLACCVLALFGSLTPLAASSLEALDECDSRVRSAPRDPMSYYCYFLAFRTGAPVDETIRRLEAILAVNPELHRARMFIGMVESSFGGPRAEQLLRDAVDGMEEAGDDHGVVYGALSLAFLLGDAGRLDEADSCIERADHAAGRADDPVLSLNVLTERALMALRRSDYGKAFQLYRLAEEGVFPDGPSWLKGNVLSGITSLHWHFGDLRAAMETTRRELEIRQAGAEWRGTAKVLANQAFLAMILTNRQEFPEEECRPLIEEALEAAIAAGDLDSESRLRLIRSHWLDGEEGVRECRRAVDLANLGGDAVALWSAMSVLARKKLMLGEEHQEESFALIDTVVEEARRAGASWSLATAMFRRAELVSLVRGREETLQAWEESIEVVESIGRRQEEDLFRALTMAHWSYPYNSVIDLLLGDLQGSSRFEADLDKAFRTMERRQARSLLQGLADGKGLHASVEEERHPTLEEVRHALGDDEAMLVYQIANEWEGRSWLVTISPDGAEVRELPGSRDLDDAVTMFEGMLRSGDSVMDGPAADLFQMVTDGTLDGRIDRLRTIVVVPDGPLHRLPFTALRERTGAEPLGIRLNIDILPAVPLWMRWRIPPSYERRAAAFSMADPEISPKAAMEVFRDPAIRGGELPIGGLPRAVEEGRFVARAIGRGSSLLTGPAASESAFKTMDTESYGLLHLATHAVVDGARPELSAVLLAPGQEGEDGLLQTGEIAGLTLKDQVVILSACRGAAGPVIEGEGVMGLARAFLLAGARAVVANRWPYNDADAEQLTRLLAAEIGRGASVGEALTEARRAYASSGAPVASWAGLTLIGDGSAVPVPGGHRSWSWLFKVLVVILIVTTVTVILWRRRASRNVSG